MISEDCENFSVKPYISLSKVRDIIQQFYGLKATDLEELNSYDDRNFRFSVYEDGDPNAECHRKRLYLLKISGYLPEKCESILSLHNGIMIHLWKQGISCQRPLTSVNNRLVELVELPQFPSTDLTVGGRKRTHTLRLFTFVQGQMWSSLTPLETESYWHMGAFLARLHRHLKQHLRSWTEPISEKAWSLINAPNALDYVEFVMDENHRQLARNVLQTFRDKYSEKLRITNWIPGMVDKEFPITLIHGDPNDLNILINRTSSDDGSLDFGILDWEDCAVSRRVYDLALMLMYMMCCETTVSTAKLTEFGQAIIQGFQCEASKDDWCLTHAERTCLVILVAVRFAQSLILGEHTFRVKDPGNEYVMLTAKQGGWEKLSS
ncbi:hypothetical protein EG68_05755, partial [Paragonimus skrjabini miyazakii]